MKVEDRINDIIQESISVKREFALRIDNLSLLADISYACVSCLKQGGKIFFAGNGGSFADSQHLAAEFISRFMFDRNPLAAVALGTNSSAITAIGNDYGYTDSFARELKALGSNKDIFFAISTSGNSPNILSAVEVAKDMGLNVYGLTGKEGGLLKDVCECVRVPSTNTARIQESHILIGHLICELVEEAYFSEG